MKLLLVEDDTDLGKVLKDKWKHMVSPYTCVQLENNALN